MSKKIEVTKIEITRAEGFTEETGNTVTVSNWIEANGVIKGMAVTAPNKDGTYNKVDFKITYTDGEIYEGRYDMQYKDTAKADLAGHVSRVVSYNSNTNVDFENNAKWAEFGAKYDMGVVA